MQQQRPQWKVTPQQSMTLIAEGWSAASAREPFDPTMPQGWQEGYQLWLDLKPEWSPQAIISRTYREHATRPCELQTKAPASPAASATMASQIARFASKALERVRSISLRLIAQ